MDGWVPKGGGSLPPGDGAFERFLTAAIAAIITIMFSWRLLDDMNDDAGVDEEEKRRRRAAMYAALTSPPQLSELALDEDDVDGDNRSRGEGEVSVPLGSGRENSGTKSSERSTGVVDSSVCSSTTSRVDTSVCNTVDSSRPTGVVDTGAKSRPTSHVDSNTDSYSGEEGEWNSADLLKRFTSAPPVYLPTTPSHVETTDLDCPSVVTTDIDDYKQPGQLDSYGYNIGIPMDTDSYTDSRWEPGMQFHTFPNSQTAHRTRDRDFESNTGSLRTQEVPSIRLQSADDVTDSELLEQGTTCVDWPPDNHDDYYNVSGDSDDLQPRELDSDEELYCCSLLEPILEEDSDDLLSSSGDSDTHKPPPLPPNPPPALALRRRVSDDTNVGQLSKPWPQAVVEGVFNDCPLIPDTTDNSSSLSHDADDSESDESVQTVIARNGGSASSSQPGSLHSSPLHVASVQGREDRDLLTEKEVREEPDRRDEHGDTFPDQATLLSPLLSLRRCQPSDDTHVDTDLTVEGDFYDDDNDNEDDNNSTIDNSAGGETGLQVSGETNSAPDATPLSTNPTQAPAVSTNIPSIHSVLSNSSTITVQAPAVNTNIPFNDDVVSTDLTQAPDTTTNIPDSVVFSTGPTQAPAVTANIPITSTVFTDPVSRHNLSTPCGHSDQPDSHSSSFSPGGVCVETDLDDVSTPVRTQPQDSDTDSSMAERRTRFAPPQPTPTPVDSFLTEFDDEPFARRSRRRDRSPKRSFDSDRGNRQTPTSRSDYKENRDPYTSRSDKKENRDPYTTRSNDKDGRFSNTLSTNPDTQSDKQRVETKPDLLTHDCNLTPSTQPPVSHPTHTSKDLDKLLTKQDPDTYRDKSDSESEVRQKANPVLVELKDEPFVRKVANSRTSVGSEEKLAEITPKKTDELLMELEEEPFARRRGSRRSFPPKDETDSKKPRITDYEKPSTREPNYGVTMSAPTGREVRAPITMETDLDEVYRRGEELSDVDKEFDKSNSLTTDTGSSQRGRDHAVGTYTDLMELEGEPFVRRRPPRDRVSTSKPGPTDRQNDADSHRLHTDSKNDSDSSFDKRKRDRHDLDPGQDQYSLDPDRDSSYRKDRHDLDPDRDSSYKKDRRDLDSDRDSSYRKDRHDSDFDLDSDWRKRGLNDSDNDRDSFKSARDTDPNRSLGRKSDSASIDSFLMELDEEPGSRRLGRRRRRSPARSRETESVEPPPVKALPQSRSHAFPDVIPDTCPVVHSPTVSKPPAHSKPETPETVRDTRQVPESPTLSHSGINTCHVPESPTVSPPSFVSPTRPQSSTDSGVNTRHVPESPTVSPPMFPSPTTPQTSSDSRVNTRQVLQSPSVSMPVSAPQSTAQSPSDTALVSQSPTVSLPRAVFLTHTDTHITSTPQQPDLTSQPRESLTVSESPTISMPVFIEPGPQVKVSVSSTSRIKTSTVFDKPPPDEAVQEEEGLYSDARQSSAVEQAPTGYTFTRCEYESVRSERRFFMVDQPYAADFDAFINNVPFTSESCGMLDEGDSLDPDEYINFVQDLHRPLTSPPEQNQGLPLKTPALEDGCILSGNLVSPPTVEVFQFPQNQARMPAVSSVSHHMDRANNIVRVDSVDQCSDTDREKSSRAEASSGDMLNTSFDIDSTEVREKMETDFAFLQSGNNVRLPSHREQDWDTQSPIVQSGNNVQLPSYKEQDWDTQSPVAQSGNMMDKPHREEDCGQQSATLQSGNTVLLPPPIEEEGVEKIMDDSEPMRSSTPTFNAEITPEVEDMDLPTPHTTVNTREKHSEGITGEHLPDEFDVHELGGGRTEGKRRRDGKDGRHGHRKRRKSSEQSDVDDYNYNKDTSDDITASSSQENLDSYEKNIPNKASDQSETVQQSNKPYSEESKQAEDSEHLHRDRTACDDRGDSVTSSTPVLTYSDKKGEEATCKDTPSPALVFQPPPPSQKDILRKNFLFPQSQPENTTTSPSNVWTFGGLKTSSNIPTFSAPSKPKEDSVPYVDASVKARDTHVKDVTDTRDRNDFSVNKPTPTQNLTHVQQSEEVLKLEKTPERSYTPTFSVPKRGVTVAKQDDFVKEREKQSVEVVSKIKDNKVNSVYSEDKLELKRPDSSQSSENEEADQNSEDLNIDTDKDKSGISDTDRREAMTGITTDTEVKPPTDSMSQTIEVSPRITVTSYTDSDSSHLPTPHKPPLPKPRLMSRPTPMPRSKSLGDSIGPPSSPHAAYEDEDVFRGEASDSDSHTSLHSDDEEDLLFKPKQSTPLAMEDKRPRSLKEIRRQQKSNPRPLIAPFTLPDHIILPSRIKINASRRKFLSSENLDSSPNTSLQDQFEAHKVSQQPKERRYKSPNKPLKPPSFSSQDQLEKLHYMLNYSRQSESSFDRSRVEHLHEGCILTPEGRRCILDKTMSIENLQVDLSQHLRRYGSVTSLVETDIDTGATQETNFFPETNLDIFDHIFQSHQPLQRSASMSDLVLNQQEGEPDHASRPLGLTMGLPSQTHKSTGKGRFAHRKHQKSKSLCTLETNLDDVGEEGEDGTMRRVPSVHELRVSKSLMKLNVPDWFKQSSLSKSSSCLLKYGSNSTMNSFFSPSLISSPCASTAPPVPNVVIKTRVVPPSNARSMRTPARFSSLPPTDKKTPTGPVKLPSDSIREKEKEKNKNLMPIPIVPFSQIRAMFEKKGKTKKEDAAEKVKEGKPKTDTRPLSPKAKEDKPSINVRPTSPKAKEEKVNLDVRPVSPKVKEDKVDVRPVSPKTKEEKANIGFRPVSPAPDVPSISVVTEDEFHSQETKTVSAKRTLFNTTPPSPSRSPPPAAEETFNVTVTSPSLASAPSDGGHRATNGVSDHVDGSAVLSLDKSPRSEQSFPPSSSSSARSPSISDKPPLPPSSLSVEPKSKDTSRKPSPKDSEPKSPPKDSKQQFRSIRQFFGRSKDKSSEKKSDGGSSSHDSSFSSGDGVYEKEPRRIGVSEMSRRFDSKPASTSFDRGSKDARSDLDSSYSSAEGNLDASSRSIEGVSPRTTKQQTSSSFPASVTSHPNSDRQQAPHRAGQPVDAGSSSSKGARGDSREPSKFQRRLPGAGTTYGYVSSASENGGHAMEPEPPRGQSESMATSSGEKKSVKETTV